MNKIPSKQKFLLLLQQAWFMWIIYGLSITVLLVIAIVPVEKVILNDYGLENSAEPIHKSIILLRPWFRRSILWAGIFCFTILVCQRSALRYKHLRKRILSIILILLFLFSPVYRFYRKPSPWRIYDQITGPDNNKYYYQAYSFMMGGFHVLSRLENQSLFWQTFKVLHDDPKDAGTGRSMIRPVEFVSNNHPRLYISKSGYIVSMNSNECDLAYDFNSKRAFGYNNIGDLSPFVLIDSNTVMNQNDIQDVISRMKEGCESVAEGYKPSSSYIKKPILEKALEHPNEGVRKLAQQLLDISEKEARVPQGNAQTPSPASGYPPSLKLHRTGSPWQGESFGGAHVGSTGVTRLGNFNFQFQSVSFKVVRGNFQVQSSNFKVQSGMFQFPIFAIADFQGEQYNLAL